jgi:hypothetical protein
LFHSGYNKYKTNVQGKNYSIIRNPSLNIGRQIQGFEGKFGADLVTGKTVEL